MQDFKIGAGGWAYFQVPGMDSLTAYSQAFNFVEVNSTFYSLPRFKEVSSWRQRVPPDFEFSVRCPRDLTYTYLREPRSESYKILDHILKICKILDAHFIHLLFPPGFEVTSSTRNSIRDLIGSFDFNGIRMVWEIRKSSSKNISSSLKNLMHDFQAIPCIDVSQENPLSSTEVVYSRLFGKGWHNIYQFDDEELKRIERRVSEGSPKQVRLSFHGVRMYKDAARLKIYKQTGTFPSITNSTGIASLNEVLRGDVTFPATHEQLLKRHGWKVFDVTATQRLHVSEVLRKIPKKTYSSLIELLQTVGKYLPK